MRAFVLIQRQLIGHRRPLYSGPISSASIHQAACQRWKYGARNSEAVEASRLTELLGNIAKPYGNNSDNKYGEGQQAAGNAGTFWSAVVVTTEQRVFAHPAKRR